MAKKLALEDSEKEAFNYKQPQKPIPADELKICNQESQAQRKRRLQAQSDKFKQIKQQSLNQIKSSTEKEKFQDAKTTLFEELKTMDDKVKAERASLKVGVKSEHERKINMLKRMKNLFAEEEAKNEES